MANSQFEVGTPKDNDLHTTITSYQWEEATDLLKTNPKMASQRGKLGEFPLPMALKRGAPEAFTIELIETCEEAVKMTGLNDKSFPLHLATIHSHSPKVIIALIRIYPEALDEKDEDGDTPRNCVRKHLDDFSRDAIMKPTFYWTTLLNNFRKEAEEKVGKELRSKIAMLEDQLEMEKKRNEQKISDLESQLAQKEKVNGNMHDTVVE